MWMLIVKLMSPAEWWLEPESRGRALGHRARTTSPAAGRVTTTPNGTAIGAPQVARARRLYRS